VGRIRVGTASWTDPTLLRSGRFYPPEAKTAEARLQYYAQNFDLVEVDSSYYALPEQRTAALWVERTPPDFVFDIKAFGLFTHHPVQVKALPPDVRSALGGDPQAKSIYYRNVQPPLADELWRRFHDALLPLDSAGKLGVVLFQFPPWFTPSRESYRYMEQLHLKLPQYHLGVEFRLGSWMDEARRGRVLDFLRENNLSYVSVDEPQGFHSSVPPVLAATAPVSVMRFHGHNAETWEKKGITAADRFAYLYSEQELDDWAPRIKALADGAEETHVLMNNCYQDFAVVNARQFRLLLP